MWRWARVRPPPLHAANSRSPRHSSARCSSICSRTTRTSWDRFTRGEADRCPFRNDRRHPQHAPPVPTDVPSLTFSIPCTLLLVAQLRDHVCRSQLVAPPLQSERNDTQNTTDQTTTPSIASTQKTRSLPTQTPTPVVSTTNPLRHCSSRSFSLSLSHTHSPLFFSPRPCRQTETDQKSARGRCRCQQSHHRDRAAAGRDIVTPGLRRKEKERKRARGDRNTKREGE